MLGNFQFQDPWLLVLLVVPLLLLGKQFLSKKNRRKVMQNPRLNAFQQEKSIWHYLKPLLHIIHFVALSLMIVALARPQTVNLAIEYDSSKGIDIVLAVDTSLSMMAKDLQPNRLSALKQVVEEFANNRATDRIALVEYSGEAVTRVPLTTDRNILIQEIKSLESGSLYQGTAIGVGLATAVNRLVQSKAKSKIIVLVTDGVESIDNRSDLIYQSPENAAEIANTFGIKVYTIGIGTNGFALFPYQRDPLTNQIFYRRLPVEIDEDLLRSIAKKTNAKYFRATDNESLSQIYKEINQLEKTEISSTKYYTYKEWYLQFLLPGFLLLMLWLLLRSTIYKELT